MAARTLEDAMGKRQGASYIAHLKEHRKRIVLCYERVKGKVKKSWRPFQANKGAGRRLAEYDATLERYDRELKVWAILHPKTEG